MDSIDTCYFVVWGGVAEIYEVSFSLVNPPFSTPKNHDSKQNTICVTTNCMAIITHLEFGVLLH